MSSFMWAGLIASALFIVAAAPSIDRQQTAAHRKRKTRR